MYKERDTNEEIEQFLFERGVFFDAYNNDIKVRSTHHNAMFNHIAFSACFDELAERFDTDEIEMAADHFMNVLGVISITIAIAGSALATMLISKRPVNV